MFFSFGWNVVFRLEPVGTMTMIFLCSVGTEKRSNGSLEHSNKNTFINYQRVSLINCSWLERWIVGTGNDPYLNGKYFYEN